MEGLLHYKFGELIFGEAYFQNVAVLQLLGESIVICLKTTFMLSKSPIIIIIICPCLIRTGNYQIREFDWLKRILTAV